MDYSNMYIAIPNNAGVLLLRSGDWILIGDRYSLAQIQCITGVQMKDQKPTCGRSEQDSKRK